MELHSLAQTTSYLQNSVQWMEHILCTSCKLTQLRPFQLELAVEINKKNHVFCVIATGMGSSA
ncbi:hypothetical protein R3P38DRAFT_2893837 [Favolaschia claudopus]|uniref:Uncharacterized protein n=1 Tax=Favolaschia claudopus TaxID=2862362 RepID=A0AAW0CRI4_9AGAR